VVAAKAASFLVETETRVRGRSLILTCRQPEILRGGGTGRGGDKAKKRILKLYPASSWAVLGRTRSSQANLCPSHMFFYMAITISISILLYSIMRRLGWITTT